MFLLACLECCCFGTYFTLNPPPTPRINQPRSVLEPGRTLTLAERGGEGAEVVVGADGFLVLATMNPGGDFGKKELSPALSNRFTQLWVPAITDHLELQAILESRWVVLFGFCFSFFCQGGATTKLLRRGFV